MFHRSYTEVEHRIAVATTVGNVPQALTNDKRLDNVGVNVMQFDRKLASIRENARLDAFWYLRPAWRSRAAVTKNAFDILTNRPVKAR